MLRISTSTESIGGGNVDGDGQPVEGRSPSQSPANSNDDDSRGIAAAENHNGEERIGAATTRGDTNDDTSQLQQSMMFDRDHDDSMNHSTASASLASPTRLEKLRTNHSPSQKQQTLDEWVSTGLSPLDGGTKEGQEDDGQRKRSQPIAKSLKNTPLSPGMKSVASSRPDDERSTTSNDDDHHEPLYGKRLFVQEEVDGVEIHQPFSRDEDEESIGELAEFLTPQDEDDDDEGEQHQLEKEHGQSDNNQLGVLPQHEKILFEERISQLHQQLAAVQAERDALLNKDRQQIQSMYQDPYASPMKQEGDSSNRTSPNIVVAHTTPNRNDTVVPPPTSSSPSSGNKNYTQEHVDELHKQVIELRSQIDELKVKQTSLEQSKKRLKQALKAVESHDRQKSDLLETLSRELAESTERELTLRTELDACRVKLEGFELAHAQLSGHNRDDEEGAGCSGTGVPRSPSDVATALVVSEKQNQALQAHLDELQSQNRFYQKRIADLQKEVLPKGDKEKQLYARYVEMKASLSSLAGVLEEVNGQNKLLNARVVQLESEMEGSTTAVRSIPLTVPSPQESKKLQSRVHQLESQVECLMETERVQNIRCRQLEATIESLESSGSVRCRSDSEQGVEMAATSSADSSSGTATAESTSERIVDSSSSAWTSMDSSDEYVARRGAPLSRELAACKSELEIERRQVTTLTSELHRSKAREADFKRAIEKLTGKLQAVNTDKDRVKLRKELDSLKVEMDVAAQESNNLLGEMETLLTTTQQELRKEQSKSKDLELELANLRDKQSLEPDPWQSKAPGTKDGDQSENDFLKRRNVALKQELWDLKAESAKKYAKLETLLAQTNDALSVEQQKVAVLGQEAANRQKLQDRLDSTRTELSSFNILDMLSPISPSPGSSTDIDELRKKNKALESENSALKTEMQNELNRIKREVISIHSQESDREREESQLVQDLKQKNVVLQKELSGKTAKASGLKAELDATKEKLAAEQLELQKLNRIVISLQMEGDNEIENVRASTKGDLLSKEKEIEKLSLTIAALRTEIDALKADMVKTNQKTSEKEEEARVAQAELAEEKTKTASLHNVIASLNSERHNLDEIVEENRALRTEIYNVNCNLEIAGHQLSSLDEQKSKVEEALASIKKELESERILSHDMKQSNVSLEAEVEVLKNAAKASTDEATYQKVELSAALASSQKELESEKQKLDELRCANTALQKAVDALQKNLDSLNTQAIEKANEKDVLERNFLSKEETLNQQLILERQEVETLRIANDALEKEATNLREETANAVAALKKTKKEINDLESEFAVSKLKVDSLGIEKANLEDELNSYKSDLSQSRSMLQSTEQLKAELADLLDTTKCELLSEREKSEGLEATKLSLQSEQNALEAKLAATISLKEEAEATVSQKSDKLNAAMRKIDELESSIESATSEINSLTDKLDTAITETKNKDTSLTETTNQLKEEKDRLRQALFDKSELQSEIFDTKSSLNASSETVSKLTSSLAETEEMLREERKAASNLNEEKLLLEKTRDQLQKDLKISTERVSQLEVELIETNDALESYRITVDELKVENNSLLTELHSVKSHIETTNARASLVTDHKTELENLLSTTNGMLDAERQKVEQLTTANHSLRSDIEACKVEMDMFKARMKQTIDEQTNTEKELSGVKQALTEEKETTQRLSASLSSLQSQHEDLQSSLESANSRADSLESDKCDLENQLQSTKVLLDEEKKKVEELTELTSSLESQLRECGAELEELKNEMDSAFSRADFASKRKDELERALASTEGERQKAEKRNKDLVATNGVLRSELEKLSNQFDHASTQAVDIKKTYESLLKEAKLELSNLRKYVEEQQKIVEEHVNAKESLQLEFDKIKNEHEKEYSIIVEKKQKIESKLQESKEKLRIEKLRVEELVQQNGDLETDLNKARGDLKIAVEKVATAKSDLDSQVASLKWELIAEQQKVEELTSTNESMEEEISQLRERLSTGETDVKQRCTELEELLSSTEKSLSETKESASVLASKVQSLEAEIDERETSYRELKETVKNNKKEMQSIQEESQKKCDELNDLLQAAREDLAKECQKVEDYSKLESSVQFEMDSLKEAMHRTMTTDRELALSSLREELYAEKEKVADLSKSKLSLQSKLRVLQQASESSKASAFVQERETDMMLATTKKELDATIQSNDKLKAQMEDLKLSHQRHIESELSEYHDMKIHFQKTKEELEEFVRMNEELNLKIASLQSDRSALEEKNDELTDSLQDKERKLLDIVSLQEELLAKQKMVDELENDKKVLDTQLRVATHAAETANASAGVRVWETEMMLSNTKKELQDSIAHVSALKKSMEDMTIAHGEKLEEANQLYNQSRTELATALSSIEAMSEKTASLESRIRELGKEKEGLLERVAGLARRDQIQKASLITSAEEINNLQENVRDFQERFQFLAEQLSESQSFNKSLESEKENIRRTYNKKQAEWDSDRSHLQERIRTLEQEACEGRDALESARMECNNVLSREVQLQSNFDACREELKTLETLKDRWTSERNMLTQRIHDLTNDLQQGAEAVDDARRESVLSAQQILEEQQSQWNVERDGLKDRIANLEQDLKSTREELRCCREDIISREKQMDENKVQFQAKISSMEEEMLDSRVALQDAEQNLKQAMISQKELEALFEEQKSELKDCHERLESARTRMEELQTTIFEKERDARTLTEQMQHLEERIQDLQTEKDRLSTELANNLRDAVKHSEHERSLKKVESDLGEAQIREGILENTLSDCMNELNVCKEELEICKKELFDEKYAAGVFKELISKLNKANDSLEHRNERLTEENANLKKNAGTTFNRSTAVRGRSLSDEDEFLSQQEKLQAEMNSMDRQMRTLVVERDTLRTTAVSLQEKVDTLQQTNDDLKDMVEKLERLQDEGAREQNERLEAELSKAQRTIAEVSNKAKGMRHKMSQDIEAAKAKEATLTKEIKSLKASNVAMEKRLEEQEKELDEFEQDFAMARDDARKVVEELRGQVQQLEKKNQHLSGDSTAKKVDELKNKLRQLIAQNQRLQKDIEGFKSREKKLQRELGLGGWK